MAVPFYGSRYSPDDLSQSFDITVGLRGQKPDVLLVAGVDISCSREH